MLGDLPLPAEADIGWMSQFLDGFSPEQIVTMPGRVADVIKPGAKLFIMELFWDAQKIRAASSSLNTSSLYFTCMANGNSRFYSIETFITIWTRQGSRSMSATMAGRWAYIIAVPEETITKRR